MPKRAAGRRRAGNDRAKAAIAPPAEATSPADGAPPADGLARLLESPFLAQVVPQLAPETLHQLIKHRGLADSGEIVASATSQQLTSLLDLDLWPSPQPGRDERFDADRFGEWLELLAETGDTVAARTVAALDVNLVVAGLARYVRVFDAATFEPTESSDDEPRQGGGRRSDSLECEIGGYVVRAARSEAWDAILTLLVALDTDHPDSFHAVMSGCRRVSNSAPEIDGLDDLLGTPEQQLHDVALDRERRRSQQGYSTPADARAFLQLARQRRRHRADVPAVNPLAAAYFRAADEAVASTDWNARSQKRGKESGEDGGDSAPIDAVVALLAEAGLVPGRPRALLESAEPSRLTRMRPLMSHLRDTNHTAYLLRSRELAFLANVLVAGCSVQSRPFTPQEASDAAVGICNLGLERWPAGWPDAQAHDAVAPGSLGTTLPDTFLVEHDLVAAFEAGWAALHEEVGMFVAGELIAMLTDLQCSDDDLRSELRMLQRELVAQRDAGTPWRARPALEVLAMLDVPAWACLAGLLDECPVGPAVLTASLGRQAGAVSPTAFEFIATTRQIRDIRTFMEKLPGILLT